MMKYPKMSFWIPYVISLAFGVTVFLRPALVPGVPWIVVPVIILAGVTAVLLELMRRWHGLGTGDLPESYTPQHFLLLLWLSVSAFVVGVVLHNALYALFWYTPGAPEAGDEAVFFIIAIIVVPAGFIAGTVSRFWRWAVIEPARKMANVGFHLPDRGRYFLPVGSYFWLWRFGRGIELLTAKRIRAGGVFCTVFFLGVLGLAIIRRAARDYLEGAGSRGLADSPERQATSS